MPDALKSQRVEFRLHQNLLSHLVDRQAATPQKALLELVMNAADAGARRVDIQITDTGFELADDGDGFRSEDDVRAFFATFGAPQEREKTYGRFRVGRAQIFGWAATTWESNGHLMVVDLARDGHGFELQPLDPPFPGCRIRGTWIQQVASDMARALAVALLYPPVEVWLNGTRVAMPVAEQSWTSQTDEAFYRLATHGRLQLYNQGVLVCVFEHSAFHLGGVVTTKVPIELTMARNEPLNTLCWNNIRDHLRAQAQVLHGSGASVGTDEFRSYALARVLSGDGDLEAACITVVPKQHATVRWFLNAVRNTGTIVYATRGHLGAVERAMQETRMPAVTLHFETIERMRVALSASDLRSDDEVLFEVLDRLNDRILREGDAPLAAIAVFDHESLPQPRGAGALLDRAELLGEEARLLDHARNVFARLASALRLRQRKLHLCHYEGGVLAYTDGEQYIAFSRALTDAFLARRQGAGLAMVLTWVHEQCHEGDSRNAGHDDVFHSRYHALTIEHGAEIQTAVHELDSLIYRGFIVDAAVRAGPVSPASLCWWEPGEHAQPNALSRALVVREALRRMVDDVEMGRNTAEGASQELYRLLHRTGLAVIPGEPPLALQDALTGAAPRMRLRGPTARLRALAPFDRAPGSALLESFLDTRWEDLGVIVEMPAARAPETATMKVYWAGQKVGTLTVQRRRLLWTPLAAAGDFLAAFAALADEDPRAFPWEQREPLRDLAWALIALATLASWHQGAPHQGPDGSERLWVRRREDPAATRWVVSPWAMQLDAIRSYDIDLRAWRRALEAQFPDLVVLDGVQTFTEAMAAFAQEAAAATTPEAQTLFWLRWGTAHG